MEVTVPAAPSPVGVRGTQSVSCWSGWGRRASNRTGGTSATLLVATGKRPTTVRGGLPELRPGVVLTHRLVESLLLDSFDSTDPAVGPVGAVVLAGHAAVRRLTLVIVGGALQVVAECDTDRSFDAEEPTLIGGGSRP